MPSFTKIIKILTKDISDSIKKPDINPSNRISEIRFSEICKEADLKYWRDKQSSKMKTARLISRESADSLKKLLKYYTIDQYSCEFSTKDYSKAKMACIKELKIALDLNDSNRFEKSLFSLKSMDKDKQNKRRYSSLFYNQESKEDVLIKKIEELLNFNKDNYLKF